MNKNLIFGIGIALLVGVTAFSLNQNKVKQNTTQHEPIVNQGVTTPATTVKNDSTVPLPLDTDIINSFFSLIETKRPSDAVTMMASSITNDDSQKQAWAVQFNAINSLKVINVEPSIKEEWTDTKHSYKLTLDVIMNPNSANEPIPYFGWENGQNIRWVTLIKEGKMWRVEGLATGP
jgi:hypothetical protein